MLSAFIFLLANSQSYPKSVEKVWDLTSQYTTQKRINWGVNYESIYNKERLWIKENLKYDFYDISSATVGSVPTVANPYQARDSGCKNTGTFLLNSNKFISIHGNDQYCTCSWSEDNPCPHKLQISGSGISFAGKYQFYPNTVLPVDQVFPDVSGNYGIAEPLEACDPITNPEEINGNWCIVYRGACFFQTKWQMCHDAGAIGTIIVMLDDSTGAGWQIWVEAVTTPLIGIKNSLGEQMKAAWESGNKDVVLTVGRSIGVSTPDPEYSSPEPLKTMNYYTGEFTEDEASHFTTVQFLIYNSKSDYVHFIGVNGVGSDVQVYDMDQSPPLYKGNYSVGVDGHYGFIYNEPSSGKPPVIMYAVDAWGGTVSFFNMQDELNPSPMGSITYETCDAENPDNDYLEMAVVHPSNRYMYLIPSLHLGACDYQIRLYDISSLPTITKISNIHIPEVDNNADIYSINFGVNNIAALSLSSAGVSWYDFSDAANPTPVAHIDLSEIEDTYTLGVRKSVQLTDTDVWIIQDETEFWHNFHAVRLVSPSPSSEDGEASTVCDDDEKNTWQAVAIIFIVLTLLACCASMFFFQKWNMEVNFKFHQMGEYVEEQNRQGGAKMSDETTP